jgi:glutamate synthase domain-containing protein 3
MRVCHLNTCPVGVATQDPELRKQFSGKPEFVENFFRYIAQEVREYMAQLGFRTINEMVGRVDRLNVRAAVDHYKARGLDYSAILYDPSLPADYARRNTTSQDHGLAGALDNELIAACREALESKTPVSIERKIRNVNRTVGTMLGSELTRRWGGAGLPDDTIRIRFTGSAGQSFGAFVPRGITLTLQGDGNDYVGKGLSGGKLIVLPPANASFTAEENIIVGNVALYGATSGEAYVRGLAGERFAVRNSGAVAVVEGIGDHGCEYMTGGRVVVLGKTGRNFAAGMSGGIAYIYDPHASFAPKCNPEFVDLEPLDRQDDTQLLLELLKRHTRYTGSTLASKLLADWSVVSKLFVKVMPRDYRRVLEGKSQFGAVEVAPVVLSDLEVVHG